MHRGSRRKLLHRGCRSELLGPPEARGHLSQGLGGEGRLYVHIGLSSHLLVDVRLSRDLLVNIGHDLRGSRGSGGQARHNLKGKAVVRPEQRGGKGLPRDTWWRLEVQQVTDDSTTATQAFIPRLSGHNVIVYRPA